MHFYVFYPCLLSESTINRSNVLNCFINDEKHDLFFRSKSISLGYKQEPYKKSKKIWFSQKI